MYSVPTSRAHTVLNDFVIGLIGITCRLPTCALMSPLSVIRRLGVCILSALNWYPPQKPPKAPKSLWAINSSQGYDSSRLGFSSSENSNPFPLNPGQAICLRLFSSHLQDINPKLVDKDSLCIFAVCPLCVGRSVKQESPWRQKMVFTDSFTSTAPSPSQWPHPQLISQVESCWMFGYNNVKSNWALPYGTFQIGFSNISL